MHTQRRKAGGLAEIYRLNLIRLREKAGLTLTEAADRYGCEPNYISQIERGHISVGKAALEKFSRVYNFKLEEVLRVPPEIGTPELDELWKKIFNTPEQHTCIMNRFLELISRHEAGEIEKEVIDHLDRQLTLLLRIKPTTN